MMLFLKSVNKFLISRRFAIFALVLSTAILVAGGIFPDVSLIPDNEVSRLEKSRPIIYWLSSHLHAQQLIQSPIFLLLPLLIAISVTLCTASRVRQRKKRKREQVREDVNAKISLVFQQPLAAVLGRFRDVVLRKGWMVTQADHNGVVICTCKKGENGFWGSIIFHSSLLLFMVAVIVSSLTRLDGEIVLTEGQRLPLNETGMLRINRQGRFSPSLPTEQIMLDKFEATFKQNKYPVDYSAHVSVLSDETTRREVVRVNRPLKLGRWRLFLHRYGYAPRFVLRDEAGKTVFDYFVNLVISSSENKDFFEIPSCNLRVETQYLPPSDDVAGSSDSIRAMRVRVVSNDEVLGEKDIALGGTARFGEYALTFADLRYWALFGIFSDSGYGLVVGAFALCILGLALRFALAEKWLHVKLQQTNGSVDVAIGGRSRYFPALFEEELKEVSRQMKAVQGTSA